MNTHENAARHAIDTLSATAIISSLMGWLPPLAAALGVLWYVLQIYGWFEKRFQREKNLRRRATDG